MYYATEEALRGLMELAEKDPAMLHHVVRAGQVVGMLFVAKIARQDGQVALAQGIERAANATMHLVTFADARDLCESYDCEPCP